MPVDRIAGLGSKPTEYLNHLNHRLLAAIEKNGAAFVSNAVVAGNAIWQRYGKGDVA